MAHFHTTTKIDHVKAIATTGWATSTVIKNSLRDRMYAIALNSKLEEEWNKLMNMPDLNPG